LALAKSHAVQATVDLRAHGHGLERGHRAEPVEDHRHVARDRLGRDHGHRALVGAALPSLVLAAGTTTLGQKQRQNREPQTKSQGWTE
jgi:hypothetical protein